MLTSSMGATGPDSGPSRFTDLAEGVKIAWQTQNRVGMLSPWCQSTLSRYLEQILEIQGSFQ
jgi:hypothetical protein